MRLGLGIRHAFAIVVVCALAAPAAAQTWPARPVRIIMPYSPGGGVDTVARILAQKLTEQIGTAFVVENRPGATGVLGTELVARAAPDGYTLLLSAAEFGINPAIRPKLPYDPLKDFAHISQLAAVQFILASHPSVPAKNVKDLIALAKARPGRLTYGSSGTGGAPHLAGALFQSMAGIRWLHVPFKSTATASIAVMSGEIDFVFSASRVNAPPGMDCQWITVTMDDGVSFVIGANHIMPPAHVHVCSTWIQFIGTEGALFVDDTHRDVTLSTMRNGIVYPMASMPGERVDHIYAGPMESETVHFIEAAAFGRPVLVTAEQARQVMEVCIAADLSADRNEPVRLPLPESRAGTFAG